LEAGQKHVSDHTALKLEPKKPWDITVSSASWGSAHDENVLLMAITRDFTCAYTTVWQAPTDRYFTKDTPNRL